MTTFLSTHLKHLVTFGFVCGLVSLVVKYLDEKLSSEQKQRFGIWVEDCQLRASSWSMRGLYKKGHDNAFLYCAIFIAFGTALYFAVDRVFHWNLLGRVGHPESPATTGEYFVSLLIVVLFGAMVSVLLLSTFLKPSFREAKRQFILIVANFSVVAICVYGSAVYVELQTASLKPSLFVKAYEGVGQTYDGLLICWLYFCTLCVLPFLLISASIVPISSINKILHWLAKYPKGPWSGLVFALTMLLGITRLFL